MDIPDDKELTWWAQVRSRYRFSRTVLISALLGSLLGYSIVFLELFIDLVEWQFESAWHYIRPGLITGLVVGVSVAAWFVLRESWYRWGTGGKKPVWISARETQQRTVVEWAWRLGRARYLVWQAVIVGISGALIESFHINPLYKSVSTLTFISLILLYGALGLIAGLLFWQLKVVKSHQTPDPNQSEPIEP